MLSVFSCSERSAELPHLVFHIHVGKKIIKYPGYLQTLKSLKASRSSGEWLRVAVCLLELGPAISAEGASPAFGFSPTPRGQPARVGAAQEGKVGLIYPPRQP